MRLLLFAFLILHLSACKDAETTGAIVYNAGYKEIRISDTSRLFKPDADSLNPFYYRPIDVDIWYPASVSPADSPLIFKSIVGLLEKRANEYTGSSIASGITGQIVQSYCDMLNCSDTVKVLSRTTKSYKNAKAVDGKFPLIIYLCSYNGMSFENYSLFEQLASRGYVVASVTSVGRYPGDMTMKYADLSEQVKDALQIIHTLRFEKNIDASKIGLIGYSWGGMASAYLSNEVPDVKCIVSLDGSEYHRYGLGSKEEDLDFDSIRQQGNFEKIKITMPYLRLESAATDTIKNESRNFYPFTQNLNGPKFFYTVLKAAHADFSCVSDVVLASGNCNENSRFTSVSNVTISFLDTYLKNQALFEKAVKSDPGIIPFSK